MSTIYDFDEKNGFEAIETHYFNDGWDIESLEEGGNVIILPADGEFSYAINNGGVDINNVEDVFVGDNTTYIVCKIEDNDSILLEVYEMTTNEFKANWSKSIWAKFRRDSLNTVCPKCGERMAQSVAKQTGWDEVHQFHCDKCHYTWIGFPNGKFIREGVLLSQWDVANGRSWE